METLPQVPTFRHMQPSPHEFNPQSSCNSTPMVEETHPIFNMLIQENNAQAIEPFKAQAV